MRPYSGKPYNGDPTAETIQRNLYYGETPPLAIRFSLLPVLTAEIALNRAQW